MKVNNAKICLDCDGVYSDGNKCPCCGSEVFHYLSLWVPAIRKDRVEIAAAKEVKVPWFRRLPWIGKFFRPVEIAF